MESQTYESIFTGKYIATLWYCEGYSDRHKNAFLNFQMDIVEDHNWFEGVAIDIDGVGVSPDEAKVAGIINGIHIEFDKIYKRLHYSDGHGNTLFKEIEGFPIYYVGTYNDDTGFYEGTWEYNIRKRFLFFFTRKIKAGSGTFRLRKFEEDTH